MTTFVFRVRNIPAALYKAMGGFATNGVNMTKLESYMIDGQFTATQFYADIEGHPDEPPVAPGAGGARLLHHRAADPRRLPAPPVPRRPAAGRDGGRAASGVSPDQPPVSVQPSAIIDTSASSGEEALVAFGVPDEAAAVERDVAHARAGRPGLHRDQPAVVQRPPRRTRRPAG